MNKLLSIATAALLFTSTQLKAQDKTVEPTTRNSWLKAGLNLGVPVGNVSDYTSFTLGLDLKGQILQTNHIGVGLTTGYNQFFGKNGFDGFGTIPVGAFVRVYPQSQGFFIGTDLGYTVVTGYDNAKGGFYLKPQLGYHNYDWNFFGYWNNVFRSDNNGGAIGSVGIGATYNIRFAKK